jgi:hypothetical protein
VSYNLLDRYYRSRNHLTNVIARSKSAAAAAASQEVDKCFVPTEFCRQLGLGMGLRPSQLVLYGLPIRPIFSKRLPGRSQLRKKLVRGARMGRFNVAVTCVVLCYALITEHEAFTIAH